MPLSTIFSYMYIYSGGCLNIMCDLDAIHVKNVLGFFHYNITGCEISPDFEKLLLMSCLTLWKSLQTCLSPLMLWVRISIEARCTLCDKVCQWLATGQWFSDFLHNKTDRHDIIEILLKVALNTNKKTSLKRGKLIVIKHFF